MGRLSRRLCALLALTAATVVLASVAWGYTHHASKVRFVEPSPLVFDAARREGKPVFLPTSAVWCYWCKYFDHDKNSPAPLDANGVMAEALLRAYRLGGRADYLDVARCVLATLGGGRLTRSTSRTRKRRRGWPTPSTICGRTHRW